MSDTNKTDLPTHSDKASGQRVVTNNPVLTEEEHREMLTANANREEANLTLDTEAARMKDALAYDPIIHEMTKAAHVQVDPASWDDLRSLPKPPPSAGKKGVRVYVCIQHPQMIVMGPDGESILGQFQDGYLVTDDEKVWKVLEHPSQQYVKRLDNSSLVR